MDFEKVPYDEIPGELEGLRERFPPPYEEFNKLFWGNEVPREFIPFAFSALVCTTIGERIYIPWGKGMYPNTWTLLVGPSGIGLKSETIGFVQMCLKETGVGMYSSIGTSAGIRDAIAFNKGRGILYNNELGFLLQAQKAKYNAGMLDLFCEYHDYSPVETIYQLKEGPVKIPGNRRLSWIAGIQNEILQEALEDRMITSGFLPRFAIVVGKTVPVRVPVPRAVDEKKLIRIRSFLKDVMEKDLKGERVVRLKEGTEAWAVWDKFYNWLYDGVSDDRKAGFIRRLEGRIIKRASVFSVMMDRSTSSPPEVITMEGLKPAITMGLIELATLEQYEGTILAGNREIANANRVLEFIGRRDPEAVPRTELYKTRLNRRDLDEALEMLKDRGDISEGQAPTSTNRAQVYRLTNSGRESLGIPLKSERVENGWFESQKQTEGSQTNDFEGELRDGAKVN